MFLRFVVDVLEELVTRMVLLLYPWNGTDVQLIRSRLQSLTHFIRPSHRSDACSSKDKSVDSVKNKVLKNQGMRYDVFTNKSWFLNGHIIEEIFMPQTDTWDCGIACLSMISNLVSYTQMMSKLNAKYFSEMKETENNNVFSYFNILMGHWLQPFSVDIKFEGALQSKPNHSSVESILLSIGNLFSQSNRVYTQYRLHTYINNKEPFQLSREYSSALWTVDLYYELRMAALHTTLGQYFSIEYCTVYAGVREEHQTRYEWYNRQHSDADHIRAQDTFTICQVSIYVCMCICVYLKLHTYHYCCP